MNAQNRPLFWIGSSLDDLKEFPEDVQRVMGFALRRVQDGGKHIDTKPLKGFGGAGVLEIIENENGNTYRGVYTVKFVEVVYVLHVFQKKSRKGISTPKHETDLIKDRLKRAEEHYCGWCKEMGYDHD